MATKKTEDDVAFEGDTVVLTRPALEDAPVPEVYRELRPWTRDTLIEQLNAAAADGWKLAAVVGTQIILERAR